MRSKSMLLGGVLCALLFLFLVSGKGFAQTKHQWHMSGNANDTGTAIVKWGGFVVDQTSPTWSSGWLNLQEPITPDPDSAWDYMQVNVPLAKDGYIDYHFWGDFTYTARFKLVTALPKSGTNPYDADVIAEVVAGITPIFLMRYNNNLTYCGADCAYVGTLIDSNAPGNSQTANLQASVFANCKVRLNDTVYATVTVNRSGCDNTWATWYAGCRTSTNGTVSITVSKNGAFCGSGSKSINSIPAPASFNAPQSISFGVGSNRWKKDWDFNGQIDYIKYGW